MSNTLLIDTDVLCYQFAFRNTDSFSWDDDEVIDEVVRPEKAKAEVDKFLTDLMEKLKGNRLYLILSDRTANFRLQLDQTYKGQRTKPKPTLWETLRTYIEEGDHGYPVKWYPRLEGDDVLGMMATHPKAGKDCIVVSIDKDMRTVPSRLYLFHKPDDGVLHIDNYDAQRYHILQTLMGDTVDNYKGIPGVGVKKAEAIMAEVPDNADLWEAVVKAYEDKGMTEADALGQARLAYILQHGDYNIKTGGIRLWTPKKLLAG